LSKDPGAVMTIGDPKLFPVGVSNCRLPRRY